MTHALLPSGFHARLPPDADAAARLERRVLDAAHAHGYERVDPPLAEFEDALAQRLISSRALESVRCVDPVRQRTLAIRPDITAQVGRIAATRMGHHPRPVRRSYAGSVLQLARAQPQHRPGIAEPHRARVVPHPGGGDAPDLRGDVGPDR